MPLTDKASGRTASVRVLLVIVIAASLALYALLMLCFIVPKIRPAKTVQGVAASYEVLTQRKELRLLADALPPTSRDIAYWVQPYGRTAFASFRLDAQEYLTWAGERGWDAKAIDEGEPVGAYVVQPSAPANAARKYVLVTNGYAYKHYAGIGRGGFLDEYDWDVQAVYDADGGMVYYSLITSH